jgi:hypothetical protein
MLVQIYLEVLDLDQSHLCVGEPLRKHVSGWIAYSAIASGGEVPSVRDKGEHAAGGDQAPAKFANPEVRRLLRCIPRAYLPLRHDRPLSTRD